MYWKNVFLHTNSLNVSNQTKNGENTKLFTSIEQERVLSLSENVARNLHISKGFMCTSTGELRNIKLEFCRNLWLGIISRSIESQ